MPTTDEGGVLRLYAASELDQGGVPVAWPDIRLVVLAGGDYRCARCLHPYRDTIDEWSACDEVCVHNGPIRVLVDNRWLSQDANVGPWYFPGFPVEARWRAVSVMSLNGQPADARWWNVAPMCNRCWLALRTLSAEEEYPLERAEWIKQRTAGWYAWRYLGQSIGPDDATNRQDELLALGPYTNA